MKVLAAALLVVAALSATGAAAPQSSTCCLDAPVSDVDPQWSKDGRRIAFVRYEKTGLSTFVTMAAGGRDERRLVSLGSDYLPNASWQRPLLSPDWTKVALIHYSTLKVRSVDGSDVHEIGAGVRRFDWSPGSKRLAFDQTDSGNNSEMFVVESDGSGLRSLGGGQSPAWSPTGDRIAFVAPSGNLYVMQADGSGRRLVYDGHGAVTYFPSWSPQGDRIAFFSRSTLIIVATDGTRLAEIPSDYEMKPPQWSFDGTLIAVETPPATSVVRVDPWEQWQFEGHRDPSWSPVANELTASFDGRCRTYGIYRISVGAKSRRLTLKCHIRGTDGPDVLTGTPSADIISGLGGDDQLLGGGAEDLLFGGPGPDDLRGGPGRDSINGNAGRDVLRDGPGNDGLRGGPGNDRILAAGNSGRRFDEPSRDIVDCGRGRHDVAFVDAIDRVSNCETVHRS